MLTSMVSESLWIVFLTWRQFTATVGTSCKDSVLAVLLESTFEVVGECDERH